MSEKIKIDMGYVIFININNTRIWNKKSKYSAANILSIENNTNAIKNIYP